jgi:hypothetical protein
VTRVLCPENTGTFFAAVNPNGFTLSGVQKYRKEARSVTRITASL